MQRDGGATRPQRRRKTAAERREQRVRAEARLVARLLGAFSGVAAHRGNAHTRLGRALAAALQAPGGRGPPGPADDALDALRWRSAEATRLCAEATERLHAMEALVATMRAEQVDLVDELAKEQHLLPRLQSEVPVAPLVACWRALRASGGLLHPAKRQLREEHERGGQDDDGGGAAAHADRRHGHSDRGPGDVLV